MHNYIQFLDEQTTSKLTEKKVVLTVKDGVPGLNTPLLLTESPGPNGPEITLSADRKYVDLDVNGAAKIGAGLIKWAKKRG